MLLYSIDINSSMRNMFGVIIVVVVIVIIVIPLRRDEGAASRYCYD